MYKFGIFITVFLFTEASAFARGHVLGCSENNTAYSHNIQITVYKNRVFPGYTAYVTDIGHNDPAQDLDLSNKPFEEFPMYLTYSEDGPSAGLPVFRSKDGDTEIKQMSDQAVECDPGQLGGIGKLACIIFSKVMSKPLKDVAVKYHGRILKAGCDRDPQWLNDINSGEAVRVSKQLNSHASQKMSEIPSVPVMVSQTAAF